MTNKPEIYCLVGVSASGKTTLAREMVKYTNAVIIGRDPLREMLFGYTPETISAYYERPDFKDKERQITDLQDNLIRLTLQGDQSVILDNTHLQLKYIKETQRYGVPVNYLLQDISVWDATERDDKRERKVGLTVIQRQYNQLEELKRVFDFARYEPVPMEKIVQDDNLPGCYVVDIDGTLAINNGRSPFDWKRVGEDSVNDSMFITNNLLKGNYGTHIVIVSGRDSVCRPETEEWLKKNGIRYNRLYMRAEGDSRKDSVVKEEFWREIVKTDYIIGMFDDRLQVINHARALGFTVFDVASNTF